MSVTLSPQNVAGAASFTGIDDGHSLQYGFFVAAPSNAGNGGYVAGGDPFSFSGVSSFLISSFAALQCTFSSQSAANGHSGFIYYYRPGAPATLANGKMQVLQANGANNTLQDIGTQAYPAAILADTIVVAACFVRL